MVGNGSRNAGGARERAAAPAVLAEIKKTSTEVARVLRVLRMLKENANRSARLLLGALACDKLPRNQGLASGVFVSYSVSTKKKGKGRGGRCRVGSTDQ